MSGAASSDYLVMKASAAVLTAASLLHLLLLLLNYADQHLLFSNVGSDRHTDWTG